MLKLYHVNIDCDATDFLVDSHSLLSCKVILLDIHTKIDFERVWWRFHIIKYKRKEYTISMNMLEAALRVNRKHINNNHQHWSILITHSVVHYPQPGVCQWIWVGRRRRRSCSRTVSNDHHFQSASSPWQICKPLVIICFTRTFSTNCFILFTTSIWVLGNHLEWVREICKSTIMMENVQSSKWRRTICQWPKSIAQDSYAWLHPDYVLHHKLLQNPFQFEPQRMLQCGACYQCGYNE